MLKKISLLLLLCALWSCDYTPIYLKKSDLGQLIKTSTLNGDPKINKTIISFLGLKENKNMNSGYTLVLNSTKRIDVVSKDKSGNPSVYRSSVIVNLVLNDANKTIKKKKFNSSFTYNNSQNKFDLSRYQKNIEINLINDIAEKIFIFLKS
tara:strand:+ start:1229 stop:1681 length:453 start_codon:yes stop_codon:yes gene_type:complete